MLPPSNVRQPRARASRSSSVSSGKYTISATHSCARNHAAGTGVPGSLAMPIGVVFTNPQIASVGLKYAQVAAKYQPNEFVIGEVSFRNQGRSRVMLVNKGHMRLYAEKATGRFIGAEVVGPAAEHLAHLMAWAHQMKMTIPQMLDMPFYHPVIEEGLRTALRDADAKLKQA